jgi:hypothetical protein
MEDSVTAVVSRRAALREWSCVCILVIFSFTSIVTWPVPYLNRLLLTYRFYCSKALPLWYVCFTRKHRVYHTNNVWPIWRISMRRGTNFMPLEAIPPLYFQISYHKYQHGEWVDFWGGSNTIVTEFRTRPSFAHPSLLTKGYRPGGEGDGVKNAWSGRTFLYSPVCLNSIVINQAQEQFYLNFFCGGWSSRNVWSL